MKNNIQKIVSLLALLFFAVAAITAQSTSPTGSSNNEDILFNRSIQNVKIKTNAAGELQLMAKLDLNVGYDKKNPKKDLSFEVQVHVDGHQIGSLLSDVQVTENDAINCAVACEPGCGSIFGAGRCITGCSCDYGGWFGIPTRPGTLKPGVKIQLSIVPTSRAEKEFNTQDDKMVFSVPRK